MRNREAIEREMHHAREDLEANLAELSHVVREKIDVTARARVAVEKGKQAAEDLVVRGIALVEERPALIGSIAAGVIAVGALIYIARRQDWI